MNEKPDYYLRQRNWGMWKLSDLKKGERFEESTRADNNSANGNPQRPNSESEQRTDHNSKTRRICREMATSNERREQLRSTNKVSKPGASKSQPKPRR